MMIGLRKLKVSNKRRFKHEETTFKRGVVGCDGLEG